MKVRAIFALVFIVCAGLLGVAFYMEHVMGLEPCPLCWLQRFGFMGVGLVSLLAALHGPGEVGVRVYGLLLAVTAGAGLGVAGRQLWLQNLPADQVPACGPSVDYMLEVLPFMEVLSTALKGTGDCAAVVWRFLGLSIPGWSAVFFVLLVIMGLTMLFHRGRVKNWLVG
ncbi:MULTISPECIES: disulfide bond formation protein B [Marinobacter]|uniref:Disulfide bond formation protein B n=1 Tax=Marinobacter xiaoshiensis TaxID=3073652 RepID=A0ABU2HC22_9GAMM|nr:MULTISPECIES: disulfide bond formation protein B [unclassified Marinobacter]MBK1873960.1 disulfide bond formation protein B [Marinobacter sp. 1-3A]MBK1887938.1 disulfide bond formation protein B [Marinobacter sp. DY40_1A1]MDS1308633.1 disulfide bond formation protein B [Marinobacter sp. F60267]